MAQKIVASHSSLFSGDNVTKPCRSLDQAIRPLGTDGLPSRRLFRILTLGRFQVCRDGRPLAWRRKSPRRALELLKALIAFGAVDVPVDHLAEALWPEAEGDRAQRAFESTLYRLRKALGDKQLLILHDARLSLDLRRIWVDAVAFAQLLKRPETVEQGLALYQGRFLEETEASWAILRREALHHKFLDQIEHVGRLHEQAGRGEQALAWYQRGLEIDPLAEAFYRRLMAVCLRLGRRAEGLAVYRRCRTALEAHVGVSPSSETDLLARQLRVTPRSMS